MMSGRKVLCHDLYGELPLAYVLGFVAAQVGTDITITTQITEAGNASTISFAARSLLITTLEEVDA